MFIIGGGPSEQELRELSKDLGIENMVVFTGKVEHDELHIHYAACDLYMPPLCRIQTPFPCLKQWQPAYRFLHRYNPLNEERQVRNGVNGYIYHDADEMYNYLLLFRINPPKKKSASARVCVNRLTRLAVKILQIT